MENEVGITAMHPIYCGVSPNQNKHLPCIKRQLPFSWVLQGHKPKNSIHS